MKLLKFVAGYFAILILLFCLFVSCGKKDSNLVARVGTRLITAQEFEQEFAKGKSTQAVRKATLEEKRAFLDNLINSKLKIIDGYQLNLHKDKTFLDRITEQERSIKFNRLIEKEVIEKIIPESALKDFHEKSNTEVKISQIALNFDPNNSDQKARALKRANEIVNRLKNNETFSAVAAETSEDAATAKTGGSKGYLKWGIVSSEDPIYAAAFSMKRNEISDPIETKNAYFIIKVDDIRSYPSRPFEQNRDKIRNQFYTFRRNEINEGYYQYLDELRVKHNLKFEAKNLELLITKLNMRPDSLSDVPQNLKELPVANFNEIEKKKIVASYHDGWITINDVIAELNKFPARRRPQFKDASELQDFIIKYRDMVPLRLLEKECDDRNIDNDAGFKKIMSNVRDNLILENAKRIQVNDKVTVTSDDVRKYFELHREEHKNPEMRDVQQIYVKDKKTAETIMNRARRGTDFTRLFRQYNQSEALKKDDGKTQMSRGRAGLGNTAFNMKINDISDPIKLGDGFYIVKLLAINEPTLKTFEEAERMITPTVRKIAFETRDAEWVKELRSRISFVIYEQNLEQAGKNFVGEDMVFSE
ncbi:MAG TPA: peptidyl-prolyl cis-trans isomerase [bacterium]